MNGCHGTDATCDGRIDDNEIMPVSYLTDEMKGFGLNWKEIEAIGNARGYRWEGAKREFVLIR